MSKSLKFLTTTFIFYSKMKNYLSLNYFNQYYLRKSIFKHHQSKTSFLFGLFLSLSIISLNGQISTVTELEGGTLGSTPVATVTVGNTDVFQPTDPNVLPFGIVRSGCGEGFPVTIEICNVNENGTLTFDIDNSYWTVDDPSPDFVEVNPTNNNPFIRTFQATFTPTSTYIDDKGTADTSDDELVTECITKTLILNNIPGNWVLFPDVKDYNNINLNSPSNTNENLEFPRVFEQQSNPIGIDATSSTLLSDIDDASVFLDPLGGIVADIAGMFPPADQACGGDNSANYLINGELLVDIDYCFQNMSFIMNPGSSIKIINGATLEISDQNGTVMINDPSFTPCDKMWKGIIVEDGTLIVDEAVIQGAEAGISVQPENRIVVRNTIFEDNYVGVDFVGDGVSQKPYSSNIGRFYGNTFRGTGSLFPQYNGQPFSVPTGSDYPYAGVRAEDYLFLPLSGIKSVSVLFPNVYDNMRFGISLRNTDANTSYSLFKDIKQSGISGFSQLSNNNLTHIGFNPRPGIQANTEIDFLNCKLGIALGRMGATIQKSQFQGIESQAILFSRCKGAFVSVKDNRFDSNITSFFSTPLVGTLEGNVFSPPVNNQNGTNIFCFEDLTSASPGNSWRILNNTMYNYQGGKTGIRVLNGTHFEIKENKIYSNSLINSEVKGIQIESSHFPELDCNVLTNSGPVLATAEGLSVTASISGEYECNAFDQWGTGVSFNNDNMRNLFKGNEMSSCLSGLLFDEEAILGPQSHKGNCWTDNQNNDLGHASNDGNFIEQSQFIINCGIDGIPDACGCDAVVLVGSGDPTDLLDTDFGEAETCASDFCQDRDGFFIPIEPEDIAVRFNNSLYSGNPNGSSLHWMSQFNFLNTLAEYETVDIENEYGIENLEAENPDLVKHLNFWNDIEYGFETMPSNEEIQLMYGEINILYDDLQNSTDPDEINVINDQIAAALAEYKSLKQDQSVLLEVSLQNIANVAQSYDNSNINNDQHISYMNFVNQMYAAYLLDADLTVTQTDLQELNLIASTCIDQGGPAVSLARALYFVLFYLKAPS